MHVLRLKHFAYALGIVAFLAPQLVRAQANLNADVEAKVRAAFSDVPEMITVAKCESGYRQFAADGSVLRGGTAKGYVGVFQIGESLHKARAAGMAHDIDTIDGNIAYARALYEKNGLSPWLDCLKPAPTSSGTTTARGWSANLRIGMSHPDVIKLQQALNKAGFTIAASGVGSPGNETPYFGALTRDAVRRFQCAKGIACDGDEATTGYGRVGPMTRSALLQL